MTFIDTLSDDTLSTLMKAGGMMWVVYKPGGQILDASPEFCKWIGYAHSQVIGMTIAAITRGEGPLDPDISKPDAFVPYSTWFSVRKQFVPNRERPQWGELCVTRHPASGSEIEFFWGWWTPATSDLETALEMAKKDADMRLIVIKEMKESVDKLSSTSDEERFLLSGLNIIQKHPRVAIAVATMLLGLFGINNVMEFLQRFGYAPVPVKIEIKDESGAVLDAPDQRADLLHQYANQISARGPE